MSVLHELEVEDHIRSEPSHDRPQDTVHIFRTPHPTLDLDIWCEIVERGAMVVISLHDADASPEGRCKR